MDEHDGIRLMEYLDGRLDAAGRAEVEAWLARDPAARAALAQHRRLWQQLGALPAPAIEASEAFRRATVERAAGERQAPVTPLRLRATALLAASLLVAVVGWAWWAARGRATLDPRDREVVGHLHLLESWDFLQAHADELDIAVRGEVLRHFEGELPAGGAR